MKYIKNTLRTLRVAALLCAVLFFSSCIEQPNSYSELPPGNWRGIMKLTEPDAVIGSGLSGEPEKIVDYFELPFNMEVSYDQAGAMEVYLVNGNEKIAIEKVHYGRDRGTAKDTVNFVFEAFDTQLEAFFEENFIEGYWVVNYKDNYKIPFLAKYGEHHRFINRTIADTENFDGQWKVTFEYDKDNAYAAIGEFKQDGNKLSGTFRTETGDYRYLDGNAFGDKMRLSVFDGSHAFLFSGSMENDTIYGEFRSGKHYKSKWMAVRDDNFSLTDPYNYTQIVNQDLTDLSFTSTDGQKVNLNDPQYDGKIKLINIMGTWCPNCKDEIIFLKEFKQKYGKDLAVFTVAFERYKDEQKALNLLSKYKTTMGFDWPLLLGGYANKKATGEAFPFLDKIYSYPTLVVVDKNNKIQYIHTGFNGPATSKYAGYKEDFDSKLKKLLSE